jgi:hypothetical protein
MRNLLALFATVTLTVIGVGWYLDWFRFQSAPGPSGHQSVTVDINTAKIARDLHEAEQKIQQKLAEKSKSTEQSSETSGKTGVPKTSTAVRIVEKSKDPQ